MKRNAIKTLFVPALLLCALVSLHAKDVTATVTSKREQTVRNRNVTRVIMQEANGQRWYVDLDTGYMMSEDLAEAINVNDKITFDDGQAGRDGGYKVTEEARIIFINGENVLVKFPSSWRDFPWAFRRDRYQR
jgi:K+ transporter